MSGHGTRTAGWRWATSYDRSSERSKADVTPDQTAALAAFIHTLRPHWDQPDILPALATQTSGSDAISLAVGVIQFAGDHDNRTPWGIARWELKTAEQKAACVEAEALGDRITAARARGTLHVVNRSGAPCP